MKKKRYFICLLPTILLSLTSCGESIKYSEHLDDYVKTLEYEDGFSILQLTDIHWNTATNMVANKNYIIELVKEVENHLPDHKLDLIELTGDQFMLSDRATVNNFISTMESLNIPYATVWGNHDREGKYNANWLSNVFLKAKNSLYTEIDHDDVYGRSNFVINLVKDNEVKWQIANIDSGASYSDSAVSLFRTYDFVRDNQIEWLKAEHDKVGEDTPMVMYYHIAQLDTEEFYLDATSSEEKKEEYKLKYYKFEEFASSDYATKDLYETFKNSGLKGAFMGHSHSNDVTFTTPEGVIMGCGVKTGKELYYAKVDKDTASEVGLDQEFNLIGGSLVTLHDTEEFELEHLYFDNYDGNTFAEWVRY